MEFEWDIGNIDKIKQRFSVDEVEEFFMQELLVIPDDEHSLIEERFIAVGTGRNRKPMFVCYTIRGNKIRVISARYMRRREVEKYEALKNNFKKSK